MKSPKRTVSIPAKQKYVINCRTNSPTVEEKTPVLFEPEDGGILPPVRISQMLTQISRGALNQVRLKRKSRTLLIIIVIYQAEQLWDI